MQRKTLVAIVCGSVAVAGLGAYAVADAYNVVPGVLTFSNVDSTPPPTMTPQSGTTVAVKDESGAPVPDPAAVESAFAPVAEAGQADPEKTYKTWAVVLDAETGDTLLDANGSTAHTPASTTKVLTALTALQTLDPAATLATGTSLSGSDVHLWGEGDLLLGREPVSGNPEQEVDGVADVRTLAQRTADALAERGLDTVTLRWNWDIFAGDSHLSSWEPQEVSSYEGHVGAFAFDSGMIDGNEQAFSQDPGGDVAAALAEELRARGIDVTLGGEAATPEGAEELATVESATVGQQVRYLLHHSDNTMADQYCRLAARAAGTDDSYTGAVAHVAETLRGLGIPTDGLALEDCSGLSSNDKIAGVTLAAAVRHSLTDSRLRDLARSLPLGGLDGTLGGRFLEGWAAGNAQAKTGSLGEVSSLAGIVQTREGRLLVFATGTADVPDFGAYNTRPILDAFIERLAAL